MAREPDLSFPVHGSPSGRLIDVGGRRVHVQIEGTGSPGVVFEAGLPGGSSLDWSLVAPRVANFATVLAYDRAGIGWTTRGERPRTMQRVATELRELLEALGVVTPVVLVGHSGGGLIVRTFQRLYPDIVSGLVLVDSSHEDQLSRIPGARRELRRMRRDLTIRSWLGAMMKPVLARRFGQSSHRFLPAAAFRARIEMESRRKFALAARDELDAIEESMRFLQAEPATRQTPTIVLTAGGNRCPEWAALQAELAAVSRAFVHRTLPGVGHDIHLEAPDAVVAAVREVVMQSSPRSHQ